MKETREKNTHHTTQLRTTRELEGAHHKMKETNNMEHKHKKDKLAISRMRASKHDGMDA
jgi:hypothetical protein